MWQRVLHAGHHIAFVDRVLVDRRVQDESLTAYAKKKQLGIQRRLNQLPHCPAQRNILSTERRRLTAAIELKEGKETLARGDIPIAREKVTSVLRMQQSWTPAVLLAALFLAPWGVEAFLRRRDDKQAATP